MSLLPPKNYSEVCKNCKAAYKALSDLYSEMQKANEREHKAEPGTHLCIDVEDAVSTLLPVERVGDMLNGPRIPLGGAADSYMLSSSRNSCVILKWTLIRHS